MLKQILHVDDDEDIRDIVFLALHEIGGIDVVQCTSGSAAVELLKTTKPDLILLDVMMPDLSGEETYRAMRQHPQVSDIPIVFMTAKGNQSAQKELMALGAAGVITKPFDPLSLADELSTIWSNV